MWHIKGKWNKILPIKTHTRCGKGHKYYSKGHTMNTTNTDALLAEKLKYLFALFVEKMSVAAVLSPSAGYAHTFNLTL